MSTVNQKEYNLFYQVPRIGTRMNSTKENRHRQTNQIKILRKYHMIKVDENIVYDTQWILGISGNKKLAIFNDWRKKHTENCKI